MKFCLKCKKEKESSEFNKSKRSKDGLTTYCRNCYKDYYLNNRDRVLLRVKVYNENPVNKTKHKIWIENNKDNIRIKARKYINNKRTKDINFKLAEILRKRIRNAVSKDFKTTSALNLLGCSIEQLKEYLQQTAIKNGYKDFNIINYNPSIYHIDHIIPCSSFELSKEEEQKKCFHYTNMQILLKEKNLKKGNTI